MKWVLAVFLIFILGCTGDKPEPVEFGKDSCAHCRMIISDHRFGGEIKTKRGKVYKFDSIECLKSFKSTDDNATIYLLDSFHKGRFVMADSAYLQEDPSLHAPMGKGYLVSASNEDFKKSAAKEKTLRWSDIVKRGEDSNAKK